MCGRVLVKARANPQHVLSHICEESRTAFCKKCGLVGILYRVDTKGCQYWRCNRALKGKVGRLKQKMRGQKKSFCEICGFVAKDPMQLDIHHMDENHHNNDPKNLQTVCGNCHRLIHYKTAEELDAIRQAGLLQRRWDILLNTENYIQNIDLENIDKEYKYNLNKKHFLTNICVYSKTAFCRHCGLVSIVLRTQKSGNSMYWDCNHGGRKRGYGKINERKCDFEKQFFRQIKNDACEKCGFVPIIKKQLDIHHKDENHKNNSLDNLQTLCVNCHKECHFNIKEKGTEERIARLLSKRWGVLIKG